MNRLRIWIAAVILTGTAGVATAQPNNANPEAPREAAGVVQIGAGSTSSVTTGSSASPPSEPNLVMPLDAEMAYPREVGPFGEMAQLPVEATPFLRCDVIEDQSARERCERRATGGAANDFGPGADTAAVRGGPAPAAEGNDPQ